MVSLSAVLVKEDDMYVAKCHEVGTVSQGKTIEEAVKNLKEATGLYVEVFSVKKKVNSIFTTYEVTKVAYA